MPFVRKTDTQGSQPPSNARKLFIGRTGELLFFVQNTLKPEEPTHNIISIWGQGGVGKSTLLARFIDEAHSAEFKDHCLTALVDERQTTPLSIMEKFADQLHMKGEFEKALKHYKEALRKQQTERESMQDAVLNRVPDFAGAAAEMVPVVGPLLREGAKATAGLYLDRHQKVQGHRDADILENPLNELTRAFVNELNQLAGSQVLPGSRRVKNRRVILCFDTFEQLATEAAPWLLNYFLLADITDTIVLVIAGRDPIERSVPEDTKHWLRYCDSETIYWIPLNSFTEDETRAYLTKRNITDPKRIATIWQLSQGLPLYLSLLTSNPSERVDPTADVVANFLRWIPKEEQTKRQVALDAALFSRPFDQDDLAAFTYLPQIDVSSLYSWLIAQPFVRSQERRYSYHDLARELFSRHLYQRSRKEYYTTRRALVQHYQQLIEEIQLDEGREVYNSIEWLELKLALVHQLLLLPDEASHIKAIEDVLNVLEHSEIEQVGEIARVLREMSHGQFTNQISSDARKLAEQLQQYIEAGRRNQERLTSATFLLETIIRKSPVSTELLARIYRMRGAVYWSLKEYPQAIADFNHALDLNSNDPVTYNTRGHLYRELGEYKQAIADFDSALTLDLKDSNAYNGRGWTYYYHKEYERAIKEFDIALELNANNTAAIKGRGWAYASLKEYQQAFADLDHLIELASSSSWAYWSRGIIYSRLKEFHRAIVDYDRAVELDPSDANAYTHRGWAYYWLKEYQQAFADFNRVHELDPNDTRAYYGRGWTYNRLKNYQRAIVDFDHAIELNPNFTRAYCGRGCICYDLKKYQQAIVDFNRALELDPNDVWVYQCRGRTYDALKNYEQAIADFNHALKLNPDYDWAYYSRGNTYLWLKDIKQAEADFIRSWEINPSFVRNGWMVQWTIMCQDKPDSGIVAQLEAIAAIDPQLDSAYICRGTAQYLRKRFEEAIAELEQAIPIEPKRWSAYFWKGMTYASLGKDEDAQAAIQKALELELPPVLLTPLRWFEQDRPEFYQEYVVPLTARYDLV